MKGIRVVGPLLCGVVGLLMVGAMPGVLSRAQANSVGPAGAADSADQKSDPGPPIRLGVGERLITLLATNDIHGGVEAAKDPKTGQPMGGMAMWSGVVKAMRQGLAAQYGSRASVVLVDGGDQFQGTLISNFNEGQLVFASMNQIGYDAVIPGNHDYDFGPVGWLDDQVTPSTVDQNPRGALTRLVGQAHFPLLSSNTFFKSSLRDSSGHAVAVDSSRCKTADLAQAGAIDWDQAKRPVFLQPYLIKDLGGLRVALIGIDNPETPTMTTVANVSDLCFRDETDAYLDLRRKLDGRADVFVMIIHNGNVKNENHVSELVKKITAAPAAPNGHLLDAVIAGHTHTLDNAVVNGVPIIQSYSGGRAFGRIDLIWDARAGAVVTSRTRHFAGVDILAKSCAPAAQPFCVETGAGALYEGKPVVVDRQITQMIAEARQQVDPLAQRKLGAAQGRLQSDRVEESSLADAMTDTVRALSGVDVAILNTGGLRAPIEAGDFTYEDLFRVLPFNNHGLIVGPMTAEKLLALLTASAQSCGGHGALMQSGLKVVFERVDCSAHPGDDKDARLVSVKTLAGETLLDVDHGVVTPPAVLVNVATFDFLSAGGSGYSQFIGIPVIQDLGILREKITEYFLKDPAVLEAATDGRWVNREAKAQTGGKPRPVSPATPSPEPDTRNTVRL